MGRDNNPKGAYALSYILGQLETLSAAAKTTLAIMLSQLLVRYIKLKDGEKRPKAIEAKTIPITSIKKLFVWIGKEILLLLKIKRLVVTNHVLVVVERNIRNVV